MLRRNFVASLAALFAARKLPKVENIPPTIIHRQRIDGLFNSNINRQNWIKIKAAEPIDVGALVKIDDTGHARECHAGNHKHIVGVCMVNNWPEDIVVALYA